MRLALILSLALTVAACDGGTEPPPVRTVYGTYVAQWSSIEPLGASTVYEYGYTLDVRLNTASGVIEGFPGGAGSMQVVRNRNVAGTVTERAFFDATVDTITGTFDLETREVRFEVQGTTGDDPVAFTFAGFSNRTFDRLDGDARGSIGDRAAPEGDVEFDHLITLRNR